MKITKLAIIFVLIAFPFTWLNRLHGSEQSYNLFTETSYNAMLDTAVDDAAYALQSKSKQSEQYAGYDSDKRYSLDVQLAASTFFNTIFLNMNATEDQTLQEVIKHYIPAVGVIGYDGFSLFTEETYSSLGQTYNKHIMRPVKSYTHVDEEGNVIHFTLDDYVVIYQPMTKHWSRGYRQELQNHTNVPLLRDGQLFDAVRRQAIIERIQYELANAINKHNEIARRNGISYTFTLPTIPDEEWQNSINDVGVIALIQGLPIGSGVYNNYALGGSRILRASLYYGVMKNGIKYAYPSHCTSANPDKVFTSPKGAAKEGYIPKRC
ncbi:hypothetical protein [Paenibacillus guangzhouensis]|uniref:hypothetical protein n=1 Tax=Paenibacillus guangzhouensis TaxID=1473112 RepID=UPI001266DA0E|nr:hypothetical protein [Paenibacillus guangzhouensis]